MSDIPAACRIFDETGVCPVTSPEWCSGCEREHPLGEMWVAPYEDGYWCIVCDGQHDLSYSCRGRSA